MLDLEEIVGDTVKLKINLVLMCLSQTIKGTKLERVLLNIKKRVLCLPVYPPINHWI